jgi:hypothetical protein
MRKVLCCVLCLAWNADMLVAEVEVQAPPAPVVATNDTPSPEEPARPPAAPTKKDSATELYPPPPPDWDYVLRVTLARFPADGRDDLLRFLQEIFPGELQSIRQTSPVRPEQAMRALTDLAHRGKELMDLRQKRPSHYRRKIALLQLDRRAETLGDGIRRAEGVARKRKVIELQKVLKESFEIKQELMQEDLDDLLRGVERMRDLVEKREQHRQDIIHRRLIYLTGHEEWKQW